MSLVIAADIQDYILLAGDHYATITASGGHGDSIALHNYCKLYPWEYGVITASHDMLSLVNYVSAFRQYRDNNLLLHLSEIGRTSKLAMLAAGRAPEESCTNIFMTLPGETEFKLYFVRIEDSHVETEIINPGDTVFSSLEEALSEDECQAFNKGLQPCLKFKNKDTFFKHNNALLSQIFATASRKSPCITPTFDYYLMEKRTGKGYLWTAGKHEERIFLSI